MFKTFPEFSKLTLADKAEYESYIRDFPPIGNLTFASLMTWWSFFNEISVSVINGNLLVPYWLPGNEDHSGLSLIGRNKIDESICAVFDFLSSRGDHPKLMHVPEDVIAHIRYPELFSFSEERADFDYIIPLNRFYPLENMNIFKRHKVARLLERIKEENIEVKQIDLTKPDNRKLILQSADKWWEKNIANFGKVERDSLHKAVFNSTQLGLDNLCLFVHGHLHGFCIFQRPRNHKKYIIVNHIKATHNSTLGYELIAYLFAKKLASQGVELINANTDEGKLRLRMFLLTMRPENFFRKYRVEPS